MSDGSEPAQGQESGQGYARGSVAYRCLTIAMLFAGFSTFSMLYLVQPLFAAEYGLRAEAASLAVSLGTGERFVGHDRGWRSAAQDCGCWRESGEQAALKLGSRR